PPPLIPYTTLFRSGRDQAAAERRIVRGAGPEHAFDRALAEPLSPARALDGVRVGEPLGRRRAEAGDDRNEGAERAATDHEEPVPECVAHAFPHAAHTADVELRDARPGVGHLDQLGNRVEADRDGHEPDAVPQEELT